MAEKAIIKRALLAADSALEKYIAANKKMGIKPEETCECDLRQNHIQKTGA